MIRLLLADDHHMFVQGVEMTLKGHPEIIVVAIAENGKQVLEALASTRVNIVIIDINMPILNGYQTTLQIVKEFPETRVIVLSMLNDEASIKKMLEAGAHGYLFKNADKSELIDAIKFVHEGRYYVAEEMSHVLDLFFKQEKDRNKGYLTYDLHPLSNREIEILKRIMNGETNQEIAKKLFLSNRTVDTHRKNILTKLNQKNTAALVKYAMEKRVFLGLDDE